jgi:PGF-pre-PGF domain-containing protein
VIKWTKKEAYEMEEKISFSLFIVMFFFFAFLIFLTPQTKSYERIGSENICHNCSDCTDAIINMSLYGGTVKLNESITNADPVSYACLEFYGNDNVIFDCQGYNIDGKDAASAYGAYMNVGADNNTIKNCNFTDWNEGVRAQWTSYARIINTTISSGGYGIEFYQCPNTTIENVTTNNNNYGIYLQSNSNNVTLRNIIANSNNEGVTLSQVYNSTFTNITANNNQYGIHLQYYGSNNVFRNNTMSNNSYNFQADSLSGQSFFNNSIDTSNLVDYSYLLYYNYSISNYVFDSTTAPNAGMVLCVGCNNITVKDLNLSHNNYAGLYFYNVTNSTVSNLSMGSNYYEIYLDSGSNNTVKNVNSTGRYYLVYLKNNINGRIENITSYGGSYLTGVYLSYCSNSTVKNIVTNNTIGIGIHISHSNDTNVINTVTNNGNRGMYIYYSNNTNLTNIIANNNSNYGLDIEYSPVQIRINNATIQENNYSDIYLYAQASSDCNNNFTNVNGSGGRPIEFYNYSANLQNRELSELILCNVNYFNVTNITIRGSDILKNNGIYGSYVYNSNFSNINSSNNQYGISLWEFNNSFVTNVITSNNSDYGIYIYQGKDNSFRDITSNYNAGVGAGFDYVYNSTITNVNSNYNSDYGISLGYLPNSTILNVTTNYNNYGIYLSSCINTTVLNSTSVYNNYSIVISSSTYNLISNVNASNSVYTGVQFTTDSNYNVLKNSYIINSGSYGIYLQYTGGKSPSYSRYNLIYNNFIKNANNVVNDGGASNVNYFNTTNSSGPNIVNGTYIGGNVWAYPNGTGFSQLASTCTDANSDGFCDTAYAPDSFNYDYLPLIGGASTCVESWTCTAWSVCVSSVQTRACSDLNACGTVLSMPAESQSCESGGGGGGGGGGTITTTVTSISSYSSTEIIINQPGIDLLKLTLIVTEDIPTASITITKVEVTSTGSLQIGLPSGESYQAFRINTIGLDSSNIKNVTIDFKVNKTWLESKNGTVSDVNLYRMPDNATEWSPLTTNYVREDSQYYYFSSLSPGFSTFVVFFGKYECQPGIKRCFNEQTQLCLGNATWLITEKCNFGCDENGTCITTAPQSILVYTLIIAIISVAIILTSYFIYLRIFKRKRR